MMFFWLEEGIIFSSEKVLCIMRDAGTDVEPLDISAKKVITPECCLLVVEGSHS